MDKVLLIATGGTIAMRKDEAGKVVPAVSGQKGHWISSTRLQMELKLHLK